MFGISLKFTKKLLEAAQTPLGELTMHPRPPSRIEPLGASTQGHPKAPPATQNASQKFLGRQNKEVEGTKFKFGQLILRKIIKIVATRSYILRLKCTKFDFGWGSAPDPARGAHSAPQAP